jgi:hypothetical protein
MCQRCCINESNSICAFCKQSICISCNKGLNASLETNNIPNGWHINFLTSFQSEIQRNPNNERDINTCASCLALIHKINLKSSYCKSLLNKQKDIFILELNKYMIAESL